MKTMPLKDLEAIKETAVEAQLKLCQAIEEVNMVKVPLEGASKTLDEAFKLSLKVQIDLLDPINRIQEEKANG